MLKSIQAKLSLIFLLSFYILHSALAQSPVQVIPSVLPPYSTLLSEYYSGDQTRLSVTLLNTDAAEPFLQGYLRISIEGQGVKLQSVPFGNYPNIDLMSGSPVTLSQSDFAPYFSPQHLQGQGAGNQNRLPEGFYQFCFEVLEKNTGRLIGSKQCAQAYLQLNDPAVLILPERGKVISYTNPFNLLFQWTPRHLNLINTEYEFTLVEVWDEGIDPQAAFFTAQPIYRTTTTTPNLFYGPAEPQLLMGKKYAWRVKTKVTTSNNEQEPFKNDGNSEVFWFKLQGECPALQRANIVADPRTNKTTLSWMSDPQQVGSVKVDYRKKGTSRWNTVEAMGNQVSLTGLAWATDYEYQLGNRCIITNDFAYGSLQSFRTLSQDTNNCVPSLPRTFSNQEPLAALRVNDTIYASDFTMRLTSVTGGNGNFSGEGYLGLIIPTTTTLVAIRASFSNISVNTDHQVIAGRIVSQYDATESNIIDVDPVFTGGVNTGNVKTGETNAIPVSTTIDPNITASIEPLIEGPGDTTYTVTVKGVDGTPVTVTTKKLPVTVQDEQGKIYSIDKDGKITLIGQSSLALLGGRTPEQLNKLDLNKGLITFQKNEEQVYALDLFKDIYGTSALLTKEYEKLNGGDYRVGNKLLITGSTDKINATLSNLYRGLSEDSIHFVTGKGIEFASKKTASGTYEITLLSGPADDAQELYAIYRDRKKNQTYSLGKLKIATYEAKSLTVNLVPLGDARVNKDQISERLNKIYNKVGISWTVQVVDSMKITRDWDIADFNRLNITGAGKYNRYSEEMQLLNAAYIAKGNVNPSTPYLFVFKQSPVAGQEESGRGVLGDMLRNRQFGYLFLQGNSDLGQVVAHELGHGLFHLPHTFDGEISLDQGDLSENLMDYEGGTELMKLQWDGIYAPGVVIGVFESEGDAASLLHPYVKCIEDATYANSLGKNFYDPDGKPVTLTSDMQPYSFFSEKEPEYYGRLAAYKQGGFTYIYLLAETSQGPEFYGRWYKVGNPPKTAQEAAALTKLSNTSTATLIKFNAQCKDVTSNKYVVNCTGCPSMPHQAKTETPKRGTGNSSGDGTVINYSEDANGNSLIEPTEADKIASVISDVNTKLGTKTKTYIINKQNKHFDELLVKANADPSKEKVIIIIDGTKNQHTINIQHKLDAPEWLRSAFEGMSSNSNGCAESYINSALQTLHATDIYRQSTLAEQVTAETLVCIYRGVFGNLYCATDEQSVANASATKKFVAGAVHELVATLDVAEMVKGLATVAKGIASAVVDAEVSYIHDQIVLCNSLVNGAPIPAEDLIQKMLPPKARLVVKAAKTATEVASNFTRFYFTECEGKTEFGSNMCPYRYGQVTMMVIPIVVTLGEWAWVKSGQMVAQLRTFKGLAKTEEVAQLLAKAETKGASVVEDLNKIVIKDGDEVTTISKSGDEVIINKSTLPSVVRQLVAKPSYRPNRTIFSKPNKTITFIGKWSEDVAGQQNGLQKIYNELTSINNKPGESVSDLNIYMQSGKFDHPGGFNMLSIEDWNTKVVNEAAKKGIAPNTKVFDDFIWETYNKPWLENAMQRGDDIILWSDPHNLPIKEFKDGIGKTFYEREIDFLSSNSQKYGYDYNGGINSGTFSK